MLVSKKILYSLVFTLLIVGFPSLNQPAHADDCQLSITEMNWASSQIVTEVSKFIIENGYDCQVTKVPSSTVPAATSLAENNKPDIATEIWINGAPVYRKLESQGKVKTAGHVLSDGGVEGFWVPKYLVDQHPELKTIEGILANPSKVGGRFHNCPSGWGCRIANDNYVQAFGIVDAMEVFNHGSGETLATSIASAFADKKPWFGYYWAPTAILGKYEMVKVDVGPYVKEAHDCAQRTDCDNPQKSDYPASPVVTGLTASFAKQQPAIFDLMTKLSFSNAIMGRLLAIKEDQNLTTEETAVYYLSNYKDIWTNWLNTEAKRKLNKIL